MKNQLASWKSSNESVLMTKKIPCSKCGQLTLEGIDHCRPKWKWHKIIMPSEKNAAKKARAAWNRATSVPKPEQMKEINQFYLNCPDGCKVVHIEKGIHELSNLIYLPK